MPSACSKTLSRFPATSARSTSRRLRFPPMLVQIAMFMLRYVEERERGMGSRAAAETAAARTGRAFIVSGMTAIAGVAVATVALGEAAAATVVTGIPVASEFTQPTEDGIRICNNRSRRMKKG